MTTFIGDYSCRVDAKGRFVFPSVFKKQMDASSGGRFVVKKDIFENCLVLYTMDEWERQAHLIRKRLNQYNKQHKEFLRGFYRGTAELELDASNRLLIPRRLLDQVGIEKEVVLAGQDGRIEIWDAGQYDQMEIDEKQFADLAENILGTESLNEEE